MSEKTIYLSTFCVDFRDYQKLRAWLDQMELPGIGVEFATSWRYPEFDTLLDQQPDRFRGIPVTLHAPFVETCCLPGTLAYREMEERFRRAFDLYHRFGASSMVMHTHEGKIPPEQRTSLQKQSETVICQLAQLASQEDIHLTVENVGFAYKENILYDQEAFLSLFKRLPGNVGALLDLGHAMVNRWDIPLVIRQLGERLRGYHLHTNDALRDLHRPLFTPGMACPPEEVETLLEAMGRWSPQADLILEYAPGDHITAGLLAQDALQARSCFCRGIRQEK